MDNVIEFPQKHIVSETMCWKCGHRFIDVRPVGTSLKDLECPYCGKGYMFDTGETFERSVDG